MHQPSTFVETDTHTLQELVSAHPLATLIVEGSGGVLVNHVPLLWNGNELHGHVARANELVGVLEEAGNQPLRARALFHGPEGYISPNDYPTKLETGKVVPTWNYAVVHIYGPLQLLDDRLWIRTQVDELTAHQEQGYRRDGVTPWTLQDAPAAFADALLGSIVGISLSIDKVEGKFKLSQNRSDADRDGATRGARTRGKDDLANRMSQTR